MAKGMYIGVNNVARKVKQIYIGVGGVARKVKKAYIGVGGVARLFFSAAADALTYSGPAASLSAARGDMGAASNSKYAFFAGGTTNGSSVVSTVTKYDENLAQSTATALTTATDEPAGGTIGDYAVIAGGNSSSAVQGYDANATKKTATALDSAGECMSFLFGDKLCFACKEVSFGQTTSWGNYINYYTSTLTKSTKSNLFGTALGLSSSGQTLRNYAAAAAGDHLITVGGRIFDTSALENGDRVYKAFAFDSNFTKVGEYDISTTYDCQRYAGVGLGDVALFVNTYVNCASNPPGYLFDKNLVKSDITPDAACVASSGYCLYSNLEGFGDKAAGVWYFYVNGAGEILPFVVDQNGVFQIGDAHTNNMARGEVDIAIVGNKLLIGGGLSGTTTSALVDAYELGA